MSLELTGDLLDAASNYITVEYTTIDAQGQPITWPVTPYVGNDGITIDVTTGLGYPKKADDAARNPKVALLFSDPTGYTGEGTAPIVFIQGDATVDDHDLDANQKRYMEESEVKLPDTQSMYPPKPLMGLLKWYFARLYIEVSPQKALVWAAGETTKEPRALVGTPAGPGREAEEPAVDVEEPAADVLWDERMDQLGERYKSAVVSWVGSDGYPLSARVPVTPDAQARRIRLGAAPAGMDLAPGLACLTAHRHAPSFTWQENFQVRGVLTEEGGEWALIPVKMVGGFELPKESQLAIAKRNYAKARRFRRIYKERVAARA